MLLPASPFCVNDPLEVCMRADLQYWRNGWFWGLAGSGAVVLIGVICEYAEVKHEFINWLPTRLWYRTFFPTHCEKKEATTWVPLWGAVGLVLIVFGLAGEIVCEALVFNADNQISVFEGHVMDEARHETAVAFERAANAEKAASGFRLQIAQANERAAQANRIAESDKLARVELENQLQARRLTAKQKEELRDMVKDDPQSIMIGFANSVLLTAKTSRTTSETHLTREVGKHSLGHRLTTSAV